MKPATLLASALLASLLAPSGLGQSLTLTQRLAAGRAMHAEYQRLKALATGPTTHPMLGMPAFAKKRSEFIPETVGQVLGVFYARFKDGRGFVYFDNFPKLPWESAPVKEPEVMDMPFGNRAMVLTANTPDFVPHAATATRLGTMFARAGYSVTKGFLTVEQLLTSKGATSASVMYLHSYGGYAPVTTGNYAIYTSTIASATTEVTHKTRLDGGELVYAMADDGALPSSASLRYGIASNFITRSMGLKPGSVVFANCGPVGASSGASIRASFLGSGADVVLSFNGRSTPDAYKNIEYLFDRWTGANLVETVTPPQRPFAYANVEARMRDLGRFKDPKTLAPIIATKAAGSTTILLRPTIHYLEVLPNNELWVRGQFGEKRTDVKVTIAGVAKTLISWSPSLIKVRLTDALTGNSGAVQVHVGLLKSNERPLTQWRGTHRTELNIHEGNLTYPANRQIVTYTLVLRGDGYMKRSKVDGVLEGTKARFSATNASKADYAVTGYVPEEPGKYVRVWFGGGTFLHTKALDGTPTAKTFSATGTIGPLGSLKLSIFTGNDLVCRFLYQDLDQYSNLGLHHIDLFDSLTPLAHLVGWKGVLDFSTMPAKTKPRWTDEGVFHEVKWTQYTATPAYVKTAPL